MASCVLAVLWDVERDNDVNKFEEEAEPVSAPCILAAARRPESGRSRDLRGIEHNAIMRKGGRGVLPQDSKSLRLPFSLNARDSVEC